VRLLERQGQSIGLLRNHHQMYMVGHQAVADQGHLMMVDAFPQQAQINFSIGVAVQDKLPRIPTLRQMMRNSNGYHPRESCHAFNSLEGRRPANPRSLRPDSAHQIAYALTQMTAVFA
jgi:hypothetical protein